MYTQKECIGNEPINNRMADMQIICISFQTDNNTSTSAFRLNALPEAQTMSKH